MLYLALWVFKIILSKEALISSFKSMCHSILLLNPYAWFDKWNYLRENRSIIELMYVVIKEIFLQLRYCGRKRNISRNPAAGRKILIRSWFC